MLNLFSPDVPVLLVGAPGVGKTALVRAQFDYAEIVLTSTLVEEDIGGLPYREGDYDFRTIPALFRRLSYAANDGKSTVLFLDELDKSRRAVADTLLTLVASRKVGNAVLPSTTCIVAAANPPEFGGGDGISEAMISRFSVIDYVPDVHEWADWAESVFSSPEAKAVIQSVRIGELAIFDMVGEGLNRRITSPRTLTMAMNAMSTHGHESPQFDSLIRGLLTPASASQILHIVTHTNSEVLNKAVSAVRRAASIAKPRYVLRL